MKRVQSHGVRVQGQRVGLYGLALNPQLSTLNRSGATLSEVLISLMVMSIGVLAAAALIPISIIRSVQATQLTNGTIHRLNAEQLIDLFPRLVHNPGLDIGTDPSAYSTKKYIVDPLGFAKMPTAAPPNDLHSWFGNDQGSTASSSRFLNRYSGSASFGTNLSLNDVGYSPDTWQLFAKGTITAGTGTQVTVPANVDLATLQASLSSGVSGIQARVILYSKNGRQSVIENLTAAGVDTTNSQLNWTNPLPAFNNQFFIDANNNGAYDAGETVVVSRFRLEMYDPRYSWLLTVRKTVNPQNTVGDASVDVVVFHKRAYSAANEQCFYVTGNPDPGNPNVTIGAFAGISVITLDLTTTNGYTPAIKPFLKRGGFIFDLQNAHWYRIVQYTDDSVNPVITLDRPLAGMIVATVNGGTPVPAIMAMPGVVEVYPLGTITYNPNNPP